MPKLNNPNLELYLIIGVFAVFVLILVIVGLCSFINEFSKELKYLNSEIRRTSGAERKRWLKRRRKLWFSILPFVKY